MKETGYWVIRTYVSGNVGEKIKFFVPGARPKKKKQYKSDVRKQEQNFYSSERNLARLINANFRQGNVILGLDYSAEGIGFIEQKAMEMIQETEKSAAEKRACVCACDNNIGIRDDEEFMRAVREAAEHELRLCFRRVKRVCEKKGIEFKCLAITSDMDGETGEAVRVHHHLIVSREVAEIFREKWTWGGSFIETMRKQEDYTEIAHYFISQVRKIPDSKKYISTRNLVRPKPKDKVAVSGAEVRVPKGCKLLFRSEYNEHRPQYIRYYVPEKETDEHIQKNEGVYLKL